MSAKWLSRLIIGLTLTFLIGPFFIIIFAGFFACNFIAFLHEPNPYHEMGFAKIRYF